MRVVDAMTREVVTCFPDDALTDAAALMAAEGRGCLVVVDSDGNRRVAGLLTDRDVCMAVGGTPVDLEQTPVRAAMSAPPFCCRPDDTLWEVLAMAETHRVRRFPVVDAQGHLIGMISLDDVAREAANPRGIPALSASEVCRVFGGNRKDPVAPSHLALVASAPSGNGSNPGVA